MTTFIHLLHQSTVLSLLLAGVLGLIIGSFLNVIIVRYPRMLMDTWRRECRLLLSSPQSLDSSIFTSEDTNATRNPTNAPRKDGSNSDTNSDIHENKSPPRRITAILSRILPIARRMTPISQHHPHPLISPHRDHIAHTATHRSPGIKTFRCSVTLLCVAVALTAVTPSQFNIP